jgi:hypothetical protein
MPRKSKTFILFGVTAGVFVALGVTLFMQSRSETEEEARRKMWRQFYGDAMKMEATKDSNGVWWYRAATNTQQTSKNPPPK